MRVKVDKRFKPAPEVIRDLGVDGRGKVQVFATERVLLHMRPYMPWLTGLTATSLTMITSPTAITVNAPYAQKLYNGMSTSGAPLNYTKATNPLAGPHWDRTMAQREGTQIAREIEVYAKGLKR